MTDLSLDDITAALRAMDGVFSIDVHHERWRQLRKWGVQSNRNGTDGSDFGKATADRARRRCDEAFGRGVGTWVHILDEEVQEAFAEEDPEKLRAELVQVATVALAWVVDIDNKKKAS